MVSECPKLHLDPRPSPGRLNVKQEEIDEMLKEAPGPINFTVFLTMFGEKLKGDPGCYITAPHGCRHGEKNVLLSLLGLSVSERHHNLNNLVFTGF